MRSTCRTRGVATRTAASSPEPLERRRLFTATGPTGTVGPDAAGHLVFTTVPATATAQTRSGVDGMTYAATDLGTVVVTVEDAAGQPSHDADGRTLTLSSAVVDVPDPDPHTGAGGAGGTADVADGVATFTDVTFTSSGMAANLVGTYTLTVSDGIDAPGTSPVVTILAPPPPSPGSVAGTVFADANGNGVRDAGEAGVGGVTIHLTAPGGADRTTTTAADGTYAFADVAVSNGAYGLTDTLPAGDTHVTPLGGAYDVSVAAGQAVAGQDFGQAPTSAVVPAGLAVRTAVDVQLFGLVQTDAAFDAAGDLFTVAANTVVELPAGSATPQPVGTIRAPGFPGDTYYFNDSPHDQLAVDAAGDVFGVTVNSTVWERPAGTTSVKNVASVYYPRGLYADAAGDAFGLGRATSTGPAAAFVVPADGSGLRWVTRQPPTAPAAVDPVAAVAVDAAGDLFGVSFTGYADTAAADLFEVPAAATATAPVVPAVLASFATADLGIPQALSVDAAGDLFVATEGTQPSVLELPAGTGQVRRLATARGVVQLASDPLVDAAGDVFALGVDATTSAATLLELPAGGTALLPLAVLPGVARGSDLTVDAAGNLYGTTIGQGAVPNSVFEVTGSGYAVARPAAATGPTASAAWVGRPPAAVAGGAVRGAVGVTLSNPTAAAIGGAVVRLYATRTGVVDADGVLVGTAPRRLRLAARRTVTTVVPVRVAGLQAGGYTLVARVTDAAGHVAAAAAGPALAVATAAVALTATSSLRTVVAGQPLSATVTLTNGGTIAAPGPLAIALGLTTTDGTTTVPLAATPHRGGLRPGQSATVRLRARAAPAVPAGTYLVAVTVTRRGVATKVYCPFEITVA